MICIFVDGVVPTTESDGADQVNQVVNSLGGIQSRSGEELNDSLVNSDSRPVRPRMTKEKQKQRALTKLQMSCRDDTVLSEEDFDIEELYTEKSEEEKARIAEAIHATVILQNITDSQRELIYNLMEKMEVKAGEAILKQSTMGYRFYIVEVRVLTEGQEDPDGKGATFFMSTKDPVRITFILVLETWPGSIRLLVPRLSLQRAMVGVGHLTDMHTTK